MPHLNSCRSWQDKARAPDPSVRRCRRTSSAHDAGIIIGMRLTSISVRNSPPVTRFDVATLSDVVVIAGPNGVGKTRLTQRIIDQLRSGQPNPDIHLAISATSPEELSAWGKSELDLS